MAEPKGGPVKPPMLDLKASKSRTTSSKTRQPTQNADTSKTGKPHPGKPNPDKPIPAAQTSASQNSTAQNASPRVTPRATKNLLSFTSPMGTAILGAIGGAILALILIIPLVLSGIIRPPLPPSSSAQLDQQILQLDALQEQNAGTLASFTSLKTQVNALSDQLSLQETEAGNQTQQLGEQVASLSQSQQSLLSQNSDLAAKQNTIIQALETVQAIEPTSFDAQDLVRDIDALKSQIAALAAGASPQDAQNMAQKFEQIQNAADILAVQLAESNQNNQAITTQITSRMDDLDRVANERLALINQQAQTIQQLTLASQSFSTSLGQIDQTVQEIQTSIAPKMPEVSQSGQAAISLAQSAIDSTKIALSNGQAFLPQLELLAIQFPDIEITSIVQETALNGLAKPSQLAQQIDLAVPQMLAARPAQPDAGFLSQISNSIKSALAIRPTGLTNGDPVENTLNQAVAAIHAQDYISAFELFESLPNSMVQALQNFSPRQDLFAQVRNFGEVQSLLNKIQQQMDDAAQTNEAGGEASS